MTEEKKYKTFSEAPRGTMKGLRAVTPNEASTSTTRSTSTSSTTSTPRTTSRPAPPAKAGIAPERDFTRVPNSVARQAVPERVFRGKSKQVYDYLWSVSRGAVVPSRTVRKSRKEIQKGSGLGSMVTVDASIDHLQTVGLVLVRPSIGSLIGNEYEVLTYEESSTSTTSTSSTTSPTQNLVVLDVLESSSTSITQAVDSKGQTNPPKTSFKTNTEKLDDEASRLALALAQAEREVTGKNASKAEQWEDLASVLITELKIAAGRTHVSSVPAFLAEHLRRRLWKKDRRQVEEEGKAAGSSQAGAALLDASQCPDCFGTGMFYPDGFDKGVVRCRHEKLTAKEGRGEV